MGENTSLREKFGRGKGKKSNTRKNYGSETNSIARKGSRGKFPLAGSRDSVPCGVWGNAPTVFRALNSKRTAHKGAGSEASLPVTLRSRRSALKLLFPQDSVKNQKRLKEHHALSLFCYDTIYLMKFVPTRFSFSGSPMASFPKAMLFTRNATFRPSVRMTCSPSASCAASCALLP